MKVFSEIKLNIKYHPNKANHKSNSKEIKLSKYV